MSILAILVQGGRGSQPRACSVRTCSCHRKGFPGSRGTPQLKKKQWTWNLKNTITFKLYKVSIACNQLETHQTPANNTCVVHCVGERRSASRQQCQHGDAWQGDNGVLLRLYNTLRIISYLGGALSFANKGLCQTLLALILETRLIESENGIYKYLSRRSRENSCFVIM